MSPPIRHVMFDADGVLQHLPGGAHAAIAPYLGERAEEFMRFTWSEELPMLAGDGDYLLALERNLLHFGITAPAHQVFADVWLTIAPHPEVLEVAAALRAGGYGVHLGTNQERHRGEYMRRTLGYEALFDVCCYSYELGAAKPTRAFFDAATERIGAAPESVLFIDDMAANVRGARAAGWSAEQWTYTDGLGSLEQILTAHGVPDRRR